MRSHAPCVSCGSSIEARAKNQTKSARTFGMWMTVRCSRRVKDAGQGRAVEFWNGPRTLLDGHVVGGRDARRLKTWTARQRPRCAARTRRLDVHIAMTYFRTVRVRGSRRCLETRRKSYAMEMRDARAEVKNDSRYHFASRRFFSTRTQFEVLCSFFGPCLSEQDVTTKTKEIERLTNGSRVALVEFLVCNVIHELVTLVEISTARERTSHFERELELVEFLRAHKLFLAEKMRLAFRESSFLRTRKNSRPRFAFNFIRARREMWVKTGEARADYVLKRLGH